MQEPPELTQFDCRVLYDYWDENRRGAQVPRVTDIDLDQFGKLLPTIFMLEKFSPKRFKYHLVGLGIIKNFGTVATGRPFVNPTDPNHSKQFSRIVETVCARPCGAFVSCTANMEHLDVLPIEQIYLPLLNDDYKCSMVMGCTAVVE